MILLLIRTMYILKWVTNSMHVFLVDQEVTDRFIDPENEAGIKEHSMMTSSTMDSSKISLENAT